MEILVSEEGGVRFLHFGSSWIQGAMRIARPWTLELDYTREMMACLLLRPEPDWPRRVLLIGLGAGSLTKFLHRHRPEAKLTVVEIAPEVIGVARQSFALPDESPRLRIVIADGVEFIMETKTRYDLILVDGYDGDAHSGFLDTLPFYLNCRERLGESGLLVTNLLSRRKDFVASIDRLKDAFDGRALAFPSCDSGNAIAFAATGEPVNATLGELKLAATALKKETGLNLTATISKLERSAVCAGGVLHL
jgi:spermidine synthase